MKKLFYILLLIICFGQSACERDDICAETTPTTPLLIIKFYDADSPSDPKAPNNLAIVAEGSIPEDTGFTVSAGTDSIAIPLRTIEDVTTYSFIINSQEEDDEPINVDDLVFTYIRYEEYVSKACGFRVIYDELLAELVPQDDGSWIQNIIIENPTVNDQVEAHISIFH